MSKLEDDKQTILTRNLIDFVYGKVLPELGKLRSNKRGGIGGHVLPPIRVSGDNQKKFARKTAPDNRYVFCHNDLARWRIIANPETLEILCLLDWEYSGFYPVEFETDHWKRSLWERSTDQEEVARLRAFMEQSGKDFTGEWTTQDRHYVLTSSTLAKRQLYAHEKDTGQDGLIVDAAFSRERLENEKEALAFIAKNTNIPVPGLIEICPGVASLTMEVKGGRMVGNLAKELYDGDKATLIMNINTFMNEPVLPQLKKLRSKKLGPLGGVFSTSPRISKALCDRGIENSSWPTKDEGTECYVFCHNDLTEHNVVVNPNTLKVICLLGWEYSGYYPPDFESTFTTTSSPETVDQGEDDREVESPGDCLIEAKTGPSRSSKDVSEKAVPSNETYDTEDLIQSP